MVRVVCGGAERGGCRRPRIRSAESRVVDATERRRCLRAAACGRAARRQTRSELIEGGSPPLAATASGHPAHQRAVWPDPNVSISAAYEQRGLDVAKLVQRESVDDV